MSTCCSSPNISFTTTTTTSYNTATTTPLTPSKSNSTKQYKTHTTTSTNNFWHNSQQQQYRATTTTTTTTTPRAPRGGGAALPPRAKIAHQLQQQLNNKNNDTTRTTRGGAVLPPRAKIGLQFCHYADEQNHAVPSVARVPCKSSSSLLRLVLAALRFLRLAMIVSAWLDQRQKRGLSLRESVSSKNTCDYVEPCLEAASSAKTPRTTRGLPEARKRSQEAVCRVSVVSFFRQAPKRKSGLNTDAAVMLR